ncbi:hypothetical protein RUND412_002033 [Rhizina undulata]
MESSNEKFVGETEFPQRSQTYGKIPIILGRVFLPTEYALMCFTASIIVFLWITGWLPWRSRSRALATDDDEGDEAVSRGNYGYFDQSHEEEEEESEENSDDMEEDDETLVRRQLLYRSSQYRGDGTVIGSEISVKVEPRDYRERSSVYPRERKPIIKQEPRTPEPRDYFSSQESNYPYTPTSKSSDARTISSATSTVTSPKTHYQVLISSHDFNFQHPSEHTTPVPGAVPSTPTSTTSPSSRSRARAAKPLFKPNDLVLRRRPTALLLKASPANRNPYEGPFKILSLHSHHPSRSNPKKTATTNRRTSKAWARLSFPPYSIASPVVRLKDLIPYTGRLEDVRMVDGERGPLGVDEEGFEVYEVEEIRGVKGVGDAKRYLVHWRGWPSEDDTWEPAAALGSEFLKEFEERELNERRVIFGI